MALMNPTAVRAIDLKEKVIDTDVTAERAAALPEYDRSHPNILYVENIREIEEELAHGFERRNAAGI
jgi:hypothetical protein